MSREDGKTFPNTVAAQNGNTVSGNLWREKELFFDKRLEKCLEILDDMNEHSEVLSGATISGLAEILKVEISRLEEMCSSLIKSVENEEYNANLPTEDVLTPQKDKPSCESNSSTSGGTPVKSEEHTEESSRLDYGAMLASIQKEVFK